MPEGPRRTDERGRISERQTNSCTLLKKWRGKASTKISTSLSHRSILVRVTRFRGIAAESPEMHHTLLTCCQNYLAIVRAQTPTHFSPRTVK